MKIYSKHIEYGDGKFIQFFPSYLSDREERFWGYRQDYYDGPIGTFGLWFFQWAWIV